MFVFVPRHILVPEFLSSDDEQALIDEVQRLVDGRARISINKKGAVMATSNDLTYKIGSIHKTRELPPRPHTTTTTTTTTTTG